MAEEEPRVTPAIRLPQLPLAANTRTGRGSESLSKLTGDVVAAPEEPEVALEADPEGEDEPQRPLRSQISGDQPSLSRDTSGLQSAVSGLLRRALLNFAEQERQRARMLVILLAAQAGALLAILPGYLLGSFQLVGTLVVLGGLAMYGVVWLLNWLGKTGEACYLLVLGGGGLVVLDLLLSAVHLLSLETLFISLLFLLVLLSSGILFSPETALIFSVLSALFTAGVLLVFPPSASLAALFTIQGHYLTVAYLVAGQLGVGVVAWLFGRQMQESIHLITYVAGLEMSNKRLHQRLRQVAQKKRHLEAGIAIIQQTHARVAAGDYSARAHVEGDLLPLAVSLNLMLERVESFVRGEHERERMETAAAGLAELAGKVGQESMGQLPVPTGTVLDGLSIAIKQMQTNVNQRLARVRQSVTALLTTVDRCQDGLLPVAEVLEEHLRSIDALVLSADNVLNSAQRQMELAAYAEQLLRSSAPAGVVLKATEDLAEQKKGTSALRLAEELERRQALAARQAERQAEETARTAEAEELSTLPESSAASLDEASAEPGGMAADDAVQQAEHVDHATLPADDEGTLPPELAVSNEAGPETGVTDTAEAVDERVTPGEPELLPEQDAAAESTASESGTGTPIDVNCEAVGDEQEQESGWDVEQLGELARVLSKMAGEAAQQERNAYTMEYKLRAMLQGMPETRRVDIMAAWLRAALEAVAQSANQVCQASKALSVSALSAGTGTSEPHKHG